MLILIFWGVIILKGKVLFCYKVSFTASDGKLISGFRVGVWWHSYNGESHCSEVWSQVQFFTDQIVRVVRRRSDGKYFVFPYEED